MTGITWWLIQTTLITAILALLLGIACLPLRRYPAIQHALWLVVLVKFVTPSLLVWPWSIQELQVFANASTVSSEPFHPLSAVASRTGMADAGVMVDGAAPSRPMTTAAGPTSRGAVERGGGRYFWLSQLVLGTWLAGTVCMMARQVRTMRQLLRVAGDAAPARDDFATEIQRLARNLRVKAIPALMARGITTPFVLCWGRLRLLWPEDRRDKASSYRGVFAHELAHVKRRDHLVTYIELIATCLWWWNPIFWVVRWQLRQSAEAACDAVALAAVPDSRRQYAELFLTFSQPTVSPGVPTVSPGVPTVLPGLLGMSSGSHRSIKRRLAMILSDDVSSRMPAPGVAAAIVLATVALPTWSLGQLAERQDAPTVLDSPAENVERDSDGDGLSDFLERHKYLTDPDKFDSDGDGRPDSDWHERREYAYTVRSIVRVMQPCGRGAGSDDFQDARMLDETDQYVELEVVHYPLATCGDAVQENADWQRDYAGMTEYLRPRINTNWDEKMRGDLLRELKDSGIDVEQLTDKQAVEKISDWYTATYKGLPMFNALHVHYPAGTAAAIPGREENIELADDSWTIDEQFEHELLGCSMFYHKTRGSCTSSAVGLTTVLRAVGIPTRMVLAIPIVDGSDPQQVAELEHLSHHHVRETAQDGVAGLGESFASHTYNEVFVGGRWRRLNYNRLGQPILDKQMFGLVTHVHTFNDLSEWGLQPTWGEWYATGRRTKALAHHNPYATLAVTDRFGQHADVDNPPNETSGPERFSVSKLYWFHSSDRPRWIPADSIKVDGSGHLLAHVDQPFDNKQFQRLYRAADKSFMLQADGHPEVKLRAERGYWNNEFYLRIGAEDFAKMVEGVPYQLSPSNEQHWEVADGLTIVKKGSVRPPDASTPRQLTIRKAYWFDSADRPDWIPWGGVAIDGSGHVLVHVFDEGMDPKERQQIYQDVDKSFLLTCDGLPDVPVRAERGNWGAEFYLRIKKSDMTKMLPGRTYKLVARNGNSYAKWNIETDVSLRRTDADSQ